MNKNIDFDLDDPLGDLLSDKSDDSFFEDMNKTSRNPSLDKKKSNLFGLDENLSKIQDDVPVKENVLSKSDWLGIPESPVENRKLAAESTFPSTEGSDKLGHKETKINLQATIKPKSNFSSDNLNFLNDLSDTDTKVPVRNNTSSSFMDDILGPSKANTKSEISVVPKVESAQLTGYNPTGGSVKTSTTRLATPGSKLDGEKNQQELKLKSPATKSITEFTSKSSRRETMGRRQRSADWLGLFPDDETIDDKEASSNRQDVTLSELLKSHNVAKTHVEKEVVKDGTESKPTEINKDPQILTSDNLNNNVTSKAMKNLLGGDIILTSAPPIQMLNNADIEQQSAAICLQQQQSQLMVALQLKAQEESLAALHERHEESRRVQHEVVSAHREQLEQLLKGQAEHRNHLHDIMMQHQQRINHHIQALLKPSSLWSDKKEGDNKPIPDEIDLKVNVGNAREEEQVRRTISEREQLESMIVNLKDNHSKELDILENSYRHQVHLINESLVSIEDRLKAENENITNYYLKRIEKLEQENMKLVEQGDEKMKSLYEKFAMEREEIEKKHKRDIEILQEQNQTVISNIRETIALERSTLKDATDYSSKLDSVLRDVEKNNTLCITYMEKMDSKYDEDILKRERILEIKEKQVAALLDNLESDRNSIEKESQETRVNLRNWEERLHIQTKALEEDKLKLKLANVELQNLKEIHKNEKEKLQVITDSERENMKRNIENMQEKYSEMEKDLAEKINKLEQDRVQLETQRKHIEESKKVYEEMQRNIESELNEIKENKRQVNITQEKLLQGETVLAARFQELETLTRSALAKHSVAERKISEATYAQQKYDEKMKELQELAISLSAREQQVARDKVALSRERLTFHNMQKEFQCGLCKSSNINSAIDLNKYATLQTHYRNINLNPDYLDAAVLRDVTTDKEKIMRKDIVKRSNVYINNINENTQMKTSGIDNIAHKIYESLDSIKQNGKPAPIFKEIVDPKLVLLKLDVLTSIRDQKTDHLDQE